MATIKSLQAKEILDSRGNPTIEATLVLNDGQAVVTSVPNGIRPYPQENFVLYDQQPEHMGGRGVQKAVALINQTIAPQLVGQDPTNQAELDQWLNDLDGTPQKSQAGANTLIAVSQAILKAGALASGLPLYQYLIQKYQLTDHVAIPTCLYGLINGGQYGAGNLDIQEFLLIPASHLDYRLSLEIESAVRSQLQKMLKDQDANYAMGELGGFTPFLQKNNEVFEIIIDAARKTSYILARDFFFGIDSGAEQLLDGGKYTLKDKSTGFTGKELTSYYKDLHDQYNLTYFEDPFGAKDTGSWQSFTADMDGNVRVAGDIITATKPTLITNAVQNKLCNTLIVKPSQVGTISETIEAIQIARQAGWGVVISQRTGETNDDLLADLAVGVGAEFVKFGPTNRGEAVSKYNRLADIYKAIEQSNQEGTAMSEPTQTNNPMPSTPPADPQTDQPAATEPTPSATPVPPADPAMDMNQLDAMPQNTNIPTAEPAAPAAAPVAPTPTTDQPTPPVAPTAPAVNPATAGMTEATPDNSQLAQPVEMGQNTAEAVATPAPAPEAPANIPPPTTPPAAPAETPQATAPAEKPLDADAQKTIDSTLAEIGATPGGSATQAPIPSAEPTAAAPIAPADNPAPADQPVTES